MSPNPGTHAPDEAASRLARGDPGPGEPAAAPGEMKEQPRPRSGSRALGIRKARLGLIDYALLALIAIGVAITVSMAIVNP